MNQKREASGIGREMRRRIRPMGLFWLPCHASPSSEP